jgi:hypothetical protein
MKERNELIEQAAIHGQNDRSVRTPHTVSTRGDSVVWRSCQAARFLRNPGYAPGAYLCTALEGSLNS